MALLRFNIGTRFNTISSTILEYFRSFARATVTTSDVIHRYTSTGKSECSANVISSTSKICWTESSITCSADVFAIPVTILVSDGSIECSATVASECIAKSVCLCTGTVSAESFTIHYQQGISQGYAHCASRAYSTSDVFIAAYDSSYEDKMFADYICVGVDDQKTINSAIMNIGALTNMRLRFAKGLYRLSDSVYIKDVDIFGAGPDRTIFEFAQTTKRGIVVRTTSSTIIDGFSITGSGTLTAIYDNPLTIGDTFTIRNIHATDYVGDILYNNNTKGKINIEVAYPLSSVITTTIPNHHLIIENCKVWDVDYSGFYLYGDTNNDTLARMLKYITIRNCHATKCGKRDDGYVVAGFNLLHNVSVEDIKITNSSSNDNWHCGYYFDDAHIRLYTMNKFIGKTMSRNANRSNVIYNLYMDNCFAIGNGKRAKDYTLDSLIPYCSGFVLREFSSGSSSVYAIPQLTVFTDGIPTYEELPIGHPSESNGPRSSDNTNITYGNIVNCIASNNLYAGFYSKGYKWNEGELNITNCYATGSEYAVVLDGHDGVKIINLVSSEINSPTVILNNVDTVVIKYMRIDHDREAQYITFNNIDGYNNLSVVDRRFCEVNGVI